MRCYLVRHAQTIWNGENRLQGHSDPPLSPLGCEQAKHLGRYFSTQSVAAVYTSALIRSRQTAEAIADQTGVALRIDPALAEMHLGLWEGLTPDEVDARFDGAYQQWRTSPLQDHIPGAEPVEQFRSRVRTAVSSIFAAHRTGAVAIVCHGGVIAALLADWLHAHYDRLLQHLTLDNAGITALDLHPHPPHILWINATHHLVLERPVVSPLPSSVST